MKRGFTIVEILIVVIVLSILTSIVAVSLSAMQNRAADGQAKSMAAILTSALNRYYQQNNEYPSAEELMSSPQANYTAASSVLNLSTQNFATQSIKFIPCSQDFSSTAPITSCSYGYFGTMAGIEEVKYITKHVNDATEERSYIVQSPNGPNTTAEYCEFRFRSDVNPRSVYVITYFSRQENKVKYIKSLQGEVDMYSPESGQCVFTAP